MVPKKLSSRLVKPLSKGQITIPIAFRRQLGITEESILSVTVKNGRLELEPLRPTGGEQTLREYSDSQIRQFLKEDRLDRRTARRVRRVLGDRPAPWARALGGCLAARS